jgi:hypothetical protein
VDVMANGGDPLQKLMNHPEFMDFMCRAKVRRSDHLYHGEAEIQRISRYYPSIGGAPLSKRTPLTPHQRSQCETGLAKLEAKLAEKGKLTAKETVNLVERREKLVSGYARADICKGATVCVCNDMTDAVLPVNYQWYVDEVNKLVDPFRS